MKQILSNLSKEAKDKHIENKKYFDKLKKRVPKNLDYVMQDLHDAEFKKTDCLQCANLCLLCFNHVYEVAVHHDCLAVVISLQKRRPLANI